MTDITDTLIIRGCVFYAVVALLMACGVMFWRWCDKKGL